MIMRSRVNVINLKSYSVDQMDKPSTKKMQKLAICFMLILASLYEIMAYKLLVISPLPGKSHSILNEAVVEHLANAGHEVTYVTVFLPEKPIPRVAIVDVTDNLKYFPEDGSMSIKSFIEKKGGGNDIITIMNMLMDMSAATLDHPNVQKFMNDNNQQFDAVIAEWMFNEVYAGFADIYKCPLIWFSTVAPHSRVLQLVDEIQNPAYTTDTMSENVPPLSFKQRVFELGLQIMGRLLKILWISRFEQEMYDKYFVPIIRNRHSSVPSLDELRYNASLLLSNSHTSMGNPVKLPPSVIQIGGFHIKPNVNPLPEDLQKIMDNAQHGAIYFSMGSNLRSKHFPDVVKKDLLKMFSKFKQTIIWKFEEDLPNTPSNVHIVKWAPQQSILAHKNCILFITHGGLLSTTESVYFGVPIVGIPVFGDQFLNVKRAVTKGYAQEISLSYSIAVDIEKAIKNVLDNPRYTTRIKELSQIYHDRPVPPAKELVHWVEHVVKTRGALHLRSPALMVPWYQKIYLDLALVLVALFLVLKYVVKYIKHNLLTKKKLKAN